MLRPRLRFLSVLLISAAAGFCALKLAPSSAADRALIEVVARSSANPPFLIDGAGTRAAPWSLQVISPHRKAGTAEPPVVISLGDDPEGIFQSSPPSPVDMAVILMNLRRLGGRDVALSSLLAWDAPDVIALTALDAELAKFRRVVTAAPLARGAGMTALPASFRRASLPLSAVAGDVSALPPVNQVSLPTVILGGGNALSGFSILERQDGTGGVPLIARWDDRAVFAFPLVAALAARGLGIDDLRVELGNFIRLGGNGPVIPIDEFGRSTAVPGRMAGGSPLPADTLIDRQEPLPAGASRLLLVRDDQSSAESVTREFSLRIAPLITDILSGAGMSPPKSYQFLPPPGEFLLLGGLCILLGLASRAGRLAGNILFVLLAGSLITAGFTLADIASLWIPVIPGLAAIAAAFLSSSFIPRASAAAASAKEPGAIDGDDAPGGPEEDQAAPEDLPPAGTPAPETTRRRKKNPPAGES